MFKWNRCRLVHILPSWPLYSVCRFMLYLGLFVYLFVVALWKRTNGTRARITALVQGETPVELDDPCPQAPVWNLLKPPPLHYHHHLPSTPLFCSMGSNMWPGPRGGWGLRTPPPTVPQRISVWVRFWLCVCVWIHACVCVLWKDEANSTESPGQVKWYRPQQSLYIATQTGPQDEYNVFWLNTETTQPCRQKERDCNRQDSRGVFFQPAN